MKRRRDGSWCSLHLKPINLSWVGSVCYTQIQQQRTPRAPPDRRCAFVFCPLTGRMIALWPITAPSAASQLQTRRGAGRARGDGRGAHGPMLRRAAIAPPESPSTPLPRTCARCLNVAPPHRPLSRAPGTVLAWTPLAGVLFLPGGRRACDRRPARWPGLAPVGACGETPPAAFPQAPAQGETPCTPWRDATCSSARKGSRPP
jgi:hypothetical protein